MGQQPVLLCQYGTAVQSYTESAEQEGKERKDDKTM